MQQKLHLSFDPSRIRTCDRSLRRRMLYPAEPVSYTHLDFLIDFENTVIVVSHDRHFLNKVCTHMADLDFGKIKLRNILVTAFYNSVRS